jgi:hypothetical protein
MQNKHKLLVYGVLTLQRRYTPPEPNPNSFPTCLWTIFVRTEYATPTRMHAYYIDKWRVASNIKLGQILTDIDRAVEIQWMKYFSVACNEVDMFTNKISFSKLMDHQNGD